MSQQVAVTEEIRELIAKNFKTTELGLVRIARNLGLRGNDDSYVIRHCHKIILSTPIARIEIRGKNYYLYSQEYAAVLTINRSSLGIITAKPYR